MPFSRYWTRTKVEKVASEIVELYEGDALSNVRERAEAAGLSGEELAAETCHNSAIAAERMFARKRCQNEMTKKDLTRLDACGQDGENT